MPSVQQVVRDPEPAVYHVATLHQQDCVPEGAGVDRL